MKKIIYTANSIAWTIAITGFLMKSTLLMGGSFLLIIGLGTAAICCVICAFLPTQVLVTNSAAPFDNYALDAHQNQPDFFVDFVFPKVIFLSSAVAAIGILFRMMSWQGNTSFLIVGGTSLVVSSALMMAKGKMRPYAILLSIVCAVLFFISRKDIVQFFHRNDSALVEKMNYQIDHPKDKAAAEAVRQHLTKHPVGK